MKLQSNRLAALAAACALCIAVPLSVDAEVTEGQVAAARTPADHEAIAKAYELDAAVADAKAREHQAMARTYRTAGGPKSSTNSMVQHCERLVKDYTEAAAEYRALAAEHRGMAKDSTK